MRSRSTLLAVLVLGSAFAACRTERDPGGTVPYTTEVAPLLEAQCLRCHADPAPAGGWRAGSYLDAIGCTASGTPVTVGPSPPLVSVFSRPDHAALAGGAEGTLARWIATGTSRSGGGTHGVGFADPRAPDSHVAFLRARRWSPLLDVNDPDACLGCHATAVGAPACTSCHTEPGGAFACGTCHGDGARAYPPRSRCFFPSDPGGGAHAAHVEANAIRQGLACAACHPTPAVASFTGTHANGHVEVWLDGALAGRRAQWDGAARRCTGTCHDHGGARPTPAWGEVGPLGCNDCHASPPANHYRGACTQCHHEANADGTALAPGALHVNGVVDLGDGSGKCGACHGQGDSPWPATGAHAAHANPASARAVPCESCHELPGAKHPVGGGAVVRFAGLATTGGRRATYDPVTKTCAGTYCHESRGGAESAPKWTGTLSTGCAACHASPPPAPHTQSATCGGTTCHEGRTDGFTMTAKGIAGHVDGIIERD